MRKIILLAFAITLCCNAIYSQKEKKSWFGVKGGFNHTVINGVETNGSKTGFVGSTLYGGLFTENHIGATTLLMNELLFSWVNDWHFLKLLFTSNKCSMSGQAFSLDQNWILPPIILTAGNKANPALQVFH